MRDLGNLRDRTPLHMHPILEELENSSIYSVKTADEVDLDVQDVERSVEDLEARPKNGLLIITITAAHTVVPDSEVILADATDGAITITLPPVIESYKNKVGRQLIIKKIDSSGNAVTVDGNESETIDGATTQSLSSQYDELHIVCNGITWYII